MEEQEIGVVTDFFAHPVVAGITLTAALKVGQKVRIRGHTTDLTLLVESMQVHNTSVMEAKPGDAIGVKVPDRVRRGDKVFLVVEAS